MIRKVKDVLGKSHPADEVVIGVGDIASLYGMTPGNFERLLRELRQYGMQKKLYEGMGKRGLHEVSEPKPDYIRSRPREKLIPKDSRGRYSVTVEQAMRIYKDEIEQWRWRVNSKGEYYTLPSDLDASLPKEYLKNSKPRRKSAAKSLAGKR